MTWLLAILIGLLTAGSIFSILRRHPVRLIVGLIMLSHAANLFVFAVPGVTPGSPAFITEGFKTPPAVIADPLPQALVLTAIVISFGLIAFALTLMYRARRVGAVNDDLSEPPGGGMP